MTVAGLAPLTALTGTATVSVASQLVVLFPAPAVPATTVSGWRRNLFQATVSALPLSGALRDVGRRVPYQEVARYCPAQR